MENWDEEGETERRSRSWKKGEKTKHTSYIDTSYIDQGKELKKATDGSQSEEAWICNPTKQAVFLLISPRTATSTKRQNIYKSSSCPRFSESTERFSPHCLSLSFAKTPLDRMTLAPSSSESLERNFNLHCIFFQQPQVNILQCCLSDFFETWYLYHYWYTSYPEAVQEYCHEQLNTSAATTAINGNI